MRRYYNIRVRSDAPGEFQTGEMCELNIEGVIFVQFIGMKRLDYQLSLILTPRVAGNLRDSLTNKLLRRSVRRSADNTVRSGAHIVVAHVLVRAVDRVHSRSTDTFRSLNFGY